MLNISFTMTHGLLEKEVRSLVLRLGLQMIVLASLVLRNVLVVQYRIAVWRGRWLNGD